MSAVIDLTEKIPPTPPWFIIIVLILIALGYRWLWVTVVGPVVTFTDNVNMIIGFMVTNIVYGLVYEYFTKE